MCCAEIYRAKEEFTPIEVVKQDADEHLKSPVAREKMHVVIDNIYKVPAGLTDQQIKDRTKLLCDVATPST